MRALMILFLCLTIAFQGIASAHVMTPTCPMQQGMPDVTMAHSATAPDCCNDAATAAKTGKLCKMGQTCSAAAAFMNTALLVLNYSPSLVDVDAPIGAIIYSSDFSLIWRPPSFS